MQYVACVVHAVYVFVCVFCACAVCVYSVLPVLSMQRVCCMCVLCVYVQCVVCLVCAVCCVSFACSVCVCGVCSVPVLCVGSIFQHHLILSLTIRECVFRWIYKLAFLFCDFCFSLSGGRGEGNLPSSAACEMQGLFTCHILCSDLTVFRPLVISVLQTPGNPAECGFPLPGEAGPQSLHFRHFFSTDAAGVGTTLL